MDLETVGGESSQLVVAAPNSNQAAAEANRTQRRRRESGTRGAESKPETKGTNKTRSGEARRWEGSGGASSAPVAVGGGGGPNPTAWKVENWSQFVFFLAELVRVCSVKAQVKLRYARNSAHRGPNKYLSWHQPKYLRPDRLTAPKAARWAAPGRFTEKS
jgi:hypothetical protein